MLRVLWDSYFSYDNSSPENPVSFVVRAKDYTFKTPSGHEISLDFDTLTVEAMQGICNGFTMNAMQWLLQHSITVTLTSHKDCVISYPDLESPSKYNHIPVKGKLTGSYSSCNLCSLMQECIDLCCRNSDILYIIRQNCIAKFVTNPEELPFSKMANQLNSILREFHINAGFYIKGSEDQEKSLYDKDLYDRFVRNMRKKRVTIDDADRYIEDEWQPPRERPSVTWDVPDPDWAPELQPLPRVILPMLPPGITPICSAAS